MNASRRLILTTLSLAATLLPAAATALPQLGAPIWPIETLEAQRPSEWESPIYIQSVYQYSSRLIVVYDRMVTTATEPLEDSQHFSLDGNKAFLEFPAPVFLAEYMSREDFDGMPKYLEYVPPLYVYGEGIKGIFSVQGWAKSPMLGWVYASYYPWVYQATTQQWLYFGEQQRQTTFTFGTSGNGDAPLPCWFKTFPEWNGMETFLPVDNELYDSVLFRLWSPRSGWLITDANLYPYCWSEAIEAWMLHGNNRAEVSGWLN